jgi:hypothetical protein
VFVTSVGAVAQDAPVPPLRLTDVSPLGEWPEGQPATLIFDRPLECAALTTSVTVVQPAGATGTVACDGDRLLFSLTSPLERGALYRLLVDGARGADGAVQEAPVAVELLAQSSLLVTSFTPSDGRDDVPTDSPITVVFNRPVVPLRTLDDQADLPNPLAFNLPVAGSGVWINTSTYQFTPEGGLPGSQTVIVTIDGLSAQDGATLAEPFVASFLTVPPVVIETYPAPDAVIGLDDAIQVRFNQPMDQASTEAAFYVQTEGGQAVAGTVTWAEDGMGFGFQPAQRLPLDGVFVFGFLADSARALGSEATLSEQSYSFLSAPAPAIINTYPLDGATDVPPYAGFTLTFNTAIDPETVLQRLSIEPAPEAEVSGFFYEYNNEYAVSFGLEPQTDYTITVATGIADVYGNTIDSPLSFSFRTGSLSPELSLNVPGGEVGIYDAARAATELFVTYLNVERVDLELSRVDFDALVQRLLGSDYYNLSDYFQPTAGEVLRQWSVETPIRESRVLELLNVGERPDAGEVITPNGLVNCPDALPSRTKPNDRVTVTVEPDPLRVRSAPQTGEIVDLLYKGYAMRVVAGPECREGIAWWQVELREGNTGWVAEGVGDEYFFEVTLSANIAPVVVPPDALTGGALPAGAYLLRASAPEFALSAPQQHIMVVANTALVMKHGTEAAMVWATDLHTGQPLPNLPLRLAYPYTEAGDLFFIDGLTDTNGVAFFSYGRRPDLYTPMAAFVRTPDRLGLVVTRWEEGLSTFNFDVTVDSYPRKYNVYLYTDRGVYRPGQTVYYRGIVRIDSDNDYLPPDLTEVPVQVTNASGEVIRDEVLPLSRYGTFTGSVTLDAAAELGYYRMVVNLPIPTALGFEGGSLGFDVAAYRVPEFEVVVEAPDEVLRGDAAQVGVQTRYFFGGAVSNAEVNANYTARPYFFAYQGAGRYSFNDYDYDLPTYIRDVYGSSTETTDAQGALTLDIPTTDVATEADSRNALPSGSLIYTVEASVTDESGQFIANRDTFIAHAADVYVGVAPREFLAAEGIETVMDVVTVDWDSQAVADQRVSYTVVERRWNSTQELDPYSGDLVWRSVVEEIPLTEGAVTTDADGKASFGFTPPSGGVYKITTRVTDAGGREAVSSAYVWASGAGYVPWRIANSTQIDLIADKPTYQVGDTAEILITSPFAGRTEALVTVERSGIIDFERITLEGNSYVYRLPITEDYAPTVYLGVMLIKGVDETNPVTDHRMGLIALPVDNGLFELDIDIEADKVQAGPQETVTYTVNVRNANGQPVQAELGVGLTDLAVLSVRPPESLPMLEHYYASERIGLLTAGTLTLNTDLITQFTRDVVKGGGGGGGGGFGILDLREEFVDTPLWLGQVETDANGKVIFSASLPDNLTTWRLDVRGLTAGDGAPMLVGQATSDLVATKPLLIRPVTPRFFVAGDAAVLGAVVNNNTDADIEAVVTLNQNGLTLTGEAAQTVTIPARGRTRVDWPVVVDAGEAVELAFSVEGGGFSDATRPMVGLGDQRLLPVYQFEVQEFVGTGGVLREAATRVETVSLPRNVPITRGDLTVRVEPSLAASTAEGVRAFENYLCACLETTASRALANLAAVRVLRAVGAPDEQYAPYDDAVNLALQRFAALQKPDGGWGWFASMESDSQTSAWVLLAMVGAREAGFSVDAGVFDLGAAYLLNSLRVTQDSPLWEMDRATLTAYALARAGYADRIGATLSNVYDFSGIRDGVIDRLSVGGQATLMLAMSASNPSDPRIGTLRDTLVSQAFITANGAQWVEPERDVFGWGSDTRTTAIVLKALLTENPLQPLLPNAVRWLMVARQGGGWETAQESAWALDALADWLVATNEANPAYDLRVVLGDAVLDSATVTPADALTARTVVVPVGELRADAPNALTVERGVGTGALYYTAYLRPFIPVSAVAPASRGFTVNREYRLADVPDAPAITSAQVGDLIEVTLTVTVANPAYYVLITDPVPAGTEPVDTRLATSTQLGTEPRFESDVDAFGYFGWWVDEQFRDEKIVLSANYLAPGTYQYRYFVRAAVEGTYNVIPATAHELYFPEVYGRSAGASFSVTGEAE